MNKRCLDHKALYLDWRCQNEITSTNRGRQKGVEGRHAPLRSTWQPLGARRLENEIVLTR